MSNRAWEQGFQEHMAQVKDTLPDVKVVWNGKHFTGRVRGRLNRFATVTIDNGASFEFSWEAVTNADITGSFLFA